MYNIIHIFSGVREMSKSGKFVSQKLFRDASPRYIFFFNQNEDHLCKVDISRISIRYQAEGFLQNFMNGDFIPVYKEIVFFIRFRECSPRALYSLRV